MVADPIFHIFINMVADPIFIFPNKEYMRYFEHPLPVRTAVGVSALPLGADIEIDVIATR